MPNPNNPDEHECQMCHDNGYRPHSNDLCLCVVGSLRALGQALTPKEWI